MLLQNEEVVTKENMEQRNKGFNPGKAERSVLGRGMDRRPRQQLAENREGKMGPGVRGGLWKKVTAISSVTIKSTWLNTGKDLL